MKEGCYRRQRSLFVLGDVMLLTADTVRRRPCRGSIPDPPAASTRASRATQESDPFAHLYADNRSPTAFDSSRSSLRPTSYPPHPRRITPIIPRVTIHS